MHAHRLPIRCLVACTILVAAAPVAGRAATPTTAPATAPAVAASAPAPVDPHVLTLLDMLQNRDATLQDFTADVHTATTHSRTDETDTRRGTVDYVKGQDDQAKFAIHFTRAGVDDTFHTVDQDLVFDGRDLIDRNNAQKQFKLVHLAKPGTHVNPLKLGEGPLPLPIGQSSAEILRQFTVTLVDADAAHHLSHLKLVPRHPGGFDFTQLDLWVDTALQLPTKMQTISTDGDPTVIVLKNVKINQGLTASAPIFSVTPPSVSSGWQVDLPDDAGH